VKVETYESLSAEGKRYGIWLTPTIMVDETVIAAGRGIPEKDIEKYVKKALQYQKENQDKNRAQSP
jgi:hypothetical protein